MEVVIDIPEDVYTRLFENGRPMDIADGIVIDRAIRNGTPLLKGLIGEIDNAYFQGYKDAVDGKFRNIMMERIKKGVKYGV